MATINSIALELIQEFEESTDDTGFVAKVEKHINNALDEVATATGWNVFHTRTPIATVATQAQYNLPAGATEVIQIRHLDNGEPVPMLTVQEVARRGIKLEDPGRPVAWLEDGHVQSGANNLYRIRLWPVPSSILNLEVEYYFAPSDVASASHIPVQDNLIVVIKDRVRATMLELDQKYEAADRAQRRYEQTLDRLIKMENSKASQKIILQEVDLINIRRRRGPRLPGSYPDYW